MVILCATTAFTATRKINITHGLQATSLSKAGLGGFQFAAGSHELPREWIILYSDPRHWKPQRRKIPLRGSLSAWLLDQTPGFPRYRRLIWGFGFTV